ncbi:MAG: DUF971 domain-containing protein [SAR324 cluster bacterium]|nr:DUF971 domain-containing protein [SAR324 cluster bacterium]
MRVKYSKKTQPKEIFFDDQMNIIWGDGHHSKYNLYDLRCDCECASCVNEITGEKILDNATVNPNIQPTSSEYVGNYGLRIFWNDGHSVGIYKFATLRDQGSFEEGQVN